MSDECSETVQVPAASLQDFVQRVLVAHSVRPLDALTVASALVLADLRGVESHGTLRLPSYLARIRAGVLEPQATPILHNLTPVVARIEANNAFGFVAAAMGIDAAADMASTMGVGVVSVRGSNHFGMSAWIPCRHMAPARSCWVVSPIACGAPGGNHGEFILDMAPSIAARGKIYKAKRRGETIPADWALDADGNPTTDPAEALTGVMLPMGGPKGSALAIMLDVFSGVLSGSAFAGGVGSLYDPSRPADIGHFFIFFKPDVFISAEEFAARMDVLYDKVTGAEKRPGVDRVWFPGEMEAKCEQERRLTGIPLRRSEIAELNTEAKKMDCALLSLP